MYVCKSVCIFVLLVRHSESVSQSVMQRCKLVNIHGLWLFSILNSPHRGAVDFVVAANNFLFHLFAALSVLMFSFPYFFFRLICLWPLLPFQLLVCWCLGLIIGGLIGSLLFQLLLFLLMQTTHFLYLYFCIFVLFYSLLL